MKKILFSLAAIAVLFAACAEATQNTEAVAPETPPATETTVPTDSEAAAATQTPTEAAPADVAKPATVAKPAAVAATMYECPMKCEKPSDKPGKCAKCGMDLAEVKKK